MLSQTSADARPHRLRDFSAPESTLEQPTHPTYGIARRRTASSSRRSGCNWIRRQARKRGVDDRGGSADRGQHPPNDRPDRRRRERFPTAASHKPRRYCRAETGASTSGSEKDRAMRLQQDGRGAQHARHGGGSDRTRSVLQAIFPARSSRARLPQTAAAMKVVINGYGAGTISMADATTIKTRATRRTTRTTSPARRSAPRSSTPRSA
jgi:hypothetical protein